MDHRIEQLKHLGLAERVRQLGNPVGPVGVAIGDYMNAMNGALKAVLFRQLSPRHGDRILEIGFGNGKLLSDLMNLAPNITYDGIDISELMVAEATAFNRALVAAGRATFHRTSSAMIPFDVGTFDRAVAINTIYFWPEPVRDLAEIRRVLKPTGVLGLAAMTPAAAAHLTASGGSMTLPNFAPCSQRQDFRGSISRLIARMHCNPTVGRFSATFTLSAR